MAGEFKGLTVKFRGDATDLTAALHTINSETSSAKRNARDFQKALAFDAGNVDAIKGAIGETGQEFLKASERADMLRQAIDEADDPNALRRLQAALAATEANADQLHGRLMELHADLAVETTPLGKVATGLQEAGSNMQTVGEKMSGVGDALTTHVTAPLVAAATASISSAVDIDTALTGVRKTVDGTEAQYQALKDAAIELSKTQPISATQILDAEALGAQLGFGIDEIEEFARVVNSLDVSTNMSWEQAATNLAQFANITKMSHDDVERYGSTIVELGNSFATTESDVSDMAMRVAAAGTQVGMSEADILGLSTALTSMGINAEAGGTAISTIMSEIDKSVSIGTTKAAEYADQMGVSVDDMIKLARTSPKAFEDIAKENGTTAKAFAKDLLSSYDQLDTWAAAANMSAEDFAKAWTDNPVQALGDVLSGMEKATEEGGNMSLMLDDLGISSLRQTDVMKRLAGNSELVGQAVETANEAWDQNNALQKEVDNRNDSLAAKFDVLKNRVTAVASEVGEPLADSFLDVVDLAGPLVEKVEGMARAFSNMSEDEQLAIVKNVAFVAGLGPVLSIAGRATEAIGKVSSNVGKGLEAAVRFEAVMQNGGTAMEGFASAAGLGAENAGALAGTLKNIAIGGGVLAGVALLGAGIKVIADEAREAEQRERNMADATDLLRQATSDMSPSLDGAAEGIEKMGEKAGDAWINIDTLASKQAEMARSFAESDEGTQSTISRLEGAKQAIDEYAGKTGLSVQEQGRLKDAIQLVNDACGTQYEVVDAANGVIKQQGDDAKITKEKLDELIESQQQQIRVEALSDQLTEAYKQQAEDIEAVANKTRYLKEAEENAAGQRSELLEQVKNGAITWGEYEAKVKGVDKYVSDAQGQLDDAKALLEANNDAIDNLNQQIGATETAASGGAQSIADLAGASVEVTNALSDSQSITDFAQALEEAGISTSNFKELSSEQLIELAANYDGTFASIEGIIAGYDIEGVAAEKASGVTGAISNEAKSTEAAAKSQAKAAEGAADFDVAQTAATNARGLPDALRVQIGPTSTAANQIKTSAKKMGDIGSQYPKGLSAAQSLGTGIRGGNGTVSSAASTVRSSASSMTSVGNTYSSGLHASSNFASGIRAGVAAVASAASAVASAAKSRLGHSVPKEGPLHEGGRGEVVYGEHLVENFAQGMLSKTYEVENAARRVALAARNGLTSVDEVYNPTISVVPSQYELQAKAIESMLSDRLSGSFEKSGPNVYINGVSGPDETARAVTRMLTLMN